MGTKRQIKAALETALEPGESIEAWRPVVANAKVEEGSFETTLALLGPSVFIGAAHGAVTADGAVPARTNLVVVTDRRILWCNKSRLSNEIALGGADPLGAIQHVDIVPARIALAKLRFTFHDSSVAQLDLPSDHGAEAFADQIVQLLWQVPSAV